MGLSPEKIVIAAVIAVIGGALVGVIYGYFVETYYPLLKFNYLLYSVIIAVISSLYGYFTYRLVEM